MNLPVPSPCRVVLRFAALTVEEWEGKVGRKDHLTRREEGTILTSEALKIEPPRQYHGRRKWHDRGGERYFGNYTEAEWNEFLEDIRKNGIKTPLWIQQDPGKEAELMEGNHRVQAADQLGIREVPVYIKYYGHSEQEGLAAPSARRRKVASQERCCSRRVALRYAGLFEPPPMVLKAVTDWAQSVWASHALALMSKTLDGPKDDSAARIRKMEALSDRGELEKTLEKAWDNGRTTRIPVSPTYDVAVKRPDDDDQDYSFFYEMVRKNQRVKFPRMPGEYARDSEWDDWYGSRYSLDHIMRTIAQEIPKGLAKYTDREAPGSRRRHLDPEHIVELSLIRREARKYTSRAKSYKTKAATVIPVDLTGWKYLNEVPASTLAAFPDVDWPALVKSRLEDANFTSFKCILWFKAHVRRGGQWSPGKMQMELDLWSTSVYDLKSFQRGMRRIASVAKHECIHLGQDALRIAKGLNEDAGLPSRDLREPGVNPSGTRIDSWSGKRIPHPKRDVEFYTRLSDEVLRFKEEVRSVAKPLRRKFFKDWLDRREFFTANKRNQGKWQKLVGEFWAALEREGIEIPKAPRAYMGKQEEGTVVWVEPVGNSNLYEPQWAIILEYLGKNSWTETDPLTGVERNPHRYSLQGLKKYIGDWNDTELNLDRTPPPRVVQQLQRSFQRSVH